MSKYRNYIDVSELPPKDFKTQFWSERRAYCLMAVDATNNNTTTYPVGIFYLYQEDPYSEILIRGAMERMPPESLKHGFSINERSYDYRRKDCRTAGRHYNPTRETHGAMNDLSYDNHVGDLEQLIQDELGNVKYS